MKNSTLIIIIAVLLIPIAALVFYKSPSHSSNSNNPEKTMTTSPTASIDPTKVEFKTAHQVVLKTNKGDIKLNLFPDDAPKTVQNFVSLGASGYYTNLTFHRVIKDFMIQGGDPNGTGTGGTSIYGAKFPDEINSHKIVVGSLAMANSGPNTNGSQFFIVTQQNQPSLDGGYTNFGQVADDASQTVVRSIAAVPTDGRDVPTQKVIIAGFEITQE